MHGHKAETVKIDMQADGIADPEIAGVTYDDGDADVLARGNFDPAALQVVRKAMVELQLLPTEPDMAPLIRRRTCRGGGGETGGRWNAPPSTSSAV